MKYDNGWTWTCHYAHKYHTASWYMSLTYILIIWRSCIVKHFYTILAVVCYISSAGDILWRCLPIWPCLRTWNIKHQNLHICTFKWIHYVQNEYGTCVIIYCYKLIYYPVSNYMSAVLFIYKTDDSCISTCYRRIFLHQWYLNTFWFTLYYEVC